MNKILSSKYWWVVVLLLLLAVNYFASIAHFRLDLTEEKRYTLSNPTKKLLRSLKEPVSISVFLSGDLPSGFKKLSKSTEELLQEFKEISGNRVQFKFEKPGEGLDDSARARVIDSLYMMGISPTNVKAQRQVHLGDCVPQRIPVIRMDRGSSQNGRILGKSDRP